MPLRNTLTPLRQNPHRYAVFEERRHRVRPARSAWSSVGNWTGPTRLRSCPSWTRCVMRVSERSSASLGTFAGHAQHVCSVAEGAAPLPGVEEVSSSWQRSATKYGVDPGDNKAPRVLASGELNSDRLRQRLFCGGHRLCPDLAHLVDGRSRSLRRFRDVPRIRISRGGGG